MSLSNIVGPRVQAHTCGRCRKDFKKGDRVCQAWIFDRKGVNPQNLGAIGAYLHEEFELVHIDCRDTDLSKGLRDV